MLITLYPNKPAMRGGKTDLSAAITRAASKQTYYTIRFLMDRDRRQDAFRAYAYFRWVDDKLDDEKGTRAEKKAFLARQCTLLESCYRRETPDDLSPEEQILVNLVEHDRESHSGLQFYLRNMMAVMTFDAERRGRLITQSELVQYSLSLSRAVTEYMFYFIGHQDSPPITTDRYQAVIGAHVVHMLRDMAADITVGYINIPAESLEDRHISVDDLNSPQFRAWVLERAQLAHQSIEAGRKYIGQVKSLRCRIAGFAYLARFEWMLGAIERDRYCLRAGYPERKSFKVVLWLLWRVYTSISKTTWTKDEPGPSVTLSDQCEE